MSGKRTLRRGGVGRASVAVAGVCLTGSVASAFTTTRAADFETEFDATNGLSADVGAAATQPGPRAEVKMLAADPGGTIWEQTLVGYLDHVVARDCDEVEAKKDEAVAEVAPAAEVAEANADAKADANADWDLEEAAPVAVTPIAEADADWDLAEGEAPAAVAAADADWDLEEPGDVATAVEVATDEVEVAAAVDPDWDLAESSTDDAVVAAATAEAEEAPAQPAADANPDWDIEDATVASASTNVTNADAQDDDLLLFP
jgi:hypothetical protein